MNKRKKKKMVTRLIEKADKEYKSLFDTIMHGDFCLDTGKKVTIGDEEYVRPRGFIKPCTNYFKGITQVLVYKGPKLVSEKTAYIEASKIIREEQ